MVYFQDRTVHMVAVLLYPAAKLADVIERQADSLLPERQLLFASIAEEADINVVFGKLHSRSHVREVASTLWLISVADSDQV